MLRCLELAQKGKVAPNPMVGAVLVANERIIGEGYHKEFGARHAEVSALSSVRSRDKQLIKRSTLYVNLEPCSHQGKTPACTDLILKQGIPKVVIGSLDPNPQVSGIEALQGIEVETGLLEQDAEYLNRRFYTFFQKQRPYVILKWAETRDGLMAPDIPKQQWISNESAQILNHKWRSEEMAIMVGTNTALIDDPELTVRNWQGTNPIRVVIDRNLSLNPKLKLFDRSTPTLVFNNSMEKKETNLERIRIDFNNKIIPQILAALHQRNIQSLLVEGGPKLLKSFVDAGLWDEARYFVGNAEFKSGLKAPQPEGREVSAEMIGDNELHILSPYNYTQ